MRTSNREQQQEQRKRQKEGGNARSFAPSSQQRDGNTYDVESNRAGGYVDSNGVLNHNYANDINQNNNEEDEGYIEELLNRQRERNNERLGLCTEFLGDLSFFFGSTMYLWLVISQAKEFLISEFIDVSDSNVEDSNRIANSTWSKSNNNNLFLEDQVVFSQITLHILYGFSAGVLMFAAGFLRFFATATSVSDKIPCAMMCLASVCVMLSSALVRTTPFLSDCFYSVAVHLFALHAATMLLWRSSSTRGMTGMSCTRLLGDFLFFLATMGAITVSYLYLFDATDWIPFPYEYLEIGSYGVWWLASIVYLLQTSCLLARHKNSDKERDGCCRRRASYYDDESSVDEQSIQKSLPQEDTESTCEDDDREESTANKRKKKNRKAAAPEEEQSVMSLWTAGPGPENRDLITRSSLDDIFGRR
mmetsp:Transcript_28437/g.77028  ORF Transcript_28437/g.77028 Transcript_28437/m.77028 type:complete len:419 (-) Transcript_28437:387-1643(-)|eukprot:CAMPEP_0172362268 /NCGR_PEP_ID=MMETSP1060-20121228/5918_1 /TAXON_ID=37318 /ORGANISM="Pseudo-nitzschia pungens, Strain cf. cingulata" /LENGTH=418 /DNA_ID=CAMNT_0013084735 /DNA_START=32 /DNA_END=1288 /DNA_ORIENTATION=+